MQIFATNIDPVVCAKNLDNRRVNKMIIESAQMLSLAVVSHTGIDPVQSGLYRITHTNHPCAIWARQSQSNFAWLHLHGLALLEEYSNRYDKPYENHKCFPVYQRLFSHSNSIPEGSLTPHPNCARNTTLGIDFTHIPDTFQAYRLYLAARNST
jgi:hypothetical protein